MVIWGMTKYQLFQKYCSIKAEKGLQLLVTPFAENGSGKLEILLQWNKVLKNKPLAEQWLKRTTSLKPLCGVKRKAWS